MRNLKFFTTKSARIFVAVFAIALVALIGLANLSRNASAATTIGSDTFSRTSTNTWGNAEVGGAYSYLGSINDFDVNGSVGTINIPSAGGTRRALLANISAQDQEVSFKFLTNKLPNNNARLSTYAILRNNSNSEYRARASVNQNGEVFINTSRVISGGSETAINSEAKVSGLTLSVNTYLNLKAQATGTNPTTIQIKIWLNGQSEPGSFQFVTADSSTQLQTSGAPGVQTYLQSSATNAPILTSFDDLNVSSLASGGTTPTPTPVATSTPTPTPVAGITPYPAISPFPYPSEFIYESNISLNSLTSMIKDSSGKDIIDIAHDLGIDILRINMYNSPVNSSHISTITKSQWDTILNKLGSYNMKMILMPMNSTYNANGEFNQYYVPFMQDLIITKGLATNPNVFAINVANETYLSSGNIAKMTEVRNIIKQANPNMLVNVGGWKTIDSTCPKEYLGSYCWGNPVDAYKIYELNDYYSVHRYGYDRPDNNGGKSVCKPGSFPPYPTPVTPYTYPDPQQHLGRYLDEIKQNIESNYPGNTKPIFLEEFGADNGIVCNSHGFYITEAHQASIYDAILSYVENAQNKINFNLIGAGNWQLYEYCQSSIAQGWGIVTKKDASGNLNCNGTFYINQAANAFKNHATAP